MFTSVILKVSILFFATFWEVLLEDASSFINIDLVDCKELLLHCGLEKLTALILEH